MISDDNKQRISKLKRDKIESILIQLFIFISTFIVSYLFEVQYNNDTNLFNDKLIDVCSIFFGVFIGSIYLFKKIEKSYEDFIRFCKALLINNLIIIFFSFFIILYNDKFPDNITLYEDYVLKPKVAVFSLYVAYFSLVLWDIKRFINMIVKILMNNRE